MSTTAIESGTTLVELASDNGAAGRLQLGSNSFFLVLFRGLQRTLSATLPTGSLRPVTVGVSPSWSDQPQDWGLQPRAGLLVVILGHFLAGVDCTLSPSDS